MLNLTLRTLKKDMLLTSLKFLGLVIGFGISYYQKNIIFKMNE